MSAVYSNNNIKALIMGSEKITELLGSIKAAHMEATHPLSNQLSLDISQVSSNPPSIITDDYSMLSGEFMYNVMVCAY